MRRTRSQQRGSVAVEFAMTFPLLIGAFGATLSLGQMLWAKYELIDYARAAARVCTSQQPVQESQMGMCVGTAVALMERYEPMPCVINNVSSTQIPGGAPSNPNLKMLVVQVDCDVTWDSAAGALAIFGQDTIHGMSSWPYLLPQ